MTALSASNQEITACTFIGTSGYFFSIWVDRDGGRLRIRHALALRFSVSETEHTTFLFYHFAEGLSIPFPKSDFEKHKFVSNVQTTPLNFYIPSCKNIKNRLAIIAKVLYNILVVRILYRHFAPIARLLQGSERKILHLKKRKVSAPVPGRARGAAGGQR